MSFSAEIYEKFYEAREQYYSQFERPRDSFALQAEYYKTTYGTHWASAMANDLREFGGIETKKASIMRQLQRYDAKEAGKGSQSRGVGAKYMAALKETTKHLPAKREIPPGTPKKKFKYSVRAYFQISRSKVWRTMTGELDEDYVREDLLDDILDNYAEDGTIAAEEWGESMLDLGEIKIS